jgi:hypothetical protein
MRTCVQHTEKFGFCTEFQNFLPYIGIFFNYFGSSVSFYKREWITSLILAV